MFAKTIYFQSEIGDTIQSFAHNICNVLNKTNIYVSGKTIVTIEFNSHVIELKSIDNSTDIIKAYYDIS
jgi:hypothetical protein